MKQRIYSVIALLLFFAVVLFFYNRNAAGGAKNSTEPIPALYTGNVSLFILRADGINGSGESFAIALW